MPDENKFAKLTQVGYMIPVHCGICRHGQFKPNTAWGTCALHLYDHLKHNEGGRGISVRQEGYCGTPELDESKVLGLGSHRMFLKGSSIS